jgi:putative mRNA 3-end processing factor
MKLQCLGAGQEVGRSAFLIKGSKNYLFDYGLKLNPRTKDPDDISTKNKAEAPMGVKDFLDGVILSHAHLDHSGAIPFLYKDGHAPLFTTQATMDLSNLLWEDTIKIAKLDKMLPLFNEHNIYEANESAFNLDINKRIEIEKDIFLTFYDAGHIPGGTISVLEMDSKKIMYTGDFRYSESYLFKGCEKKLPEVDYLITETTYALENHVPRKTIEKQFIEEVKECIDNGGIVILPAFAIERSQELIYILYKYNIDYVPIYLDGMGKKATNIFLNHSKYITDFKSFKKATERVEYVKRSNQRKKIVQKPCIIITTAGMLEGGPVLGYIDMIGDNPKNKIILTGFQVEGTNGRRLLDSKKLLIDGKEYKPKAEISKYSFSAHADKKEIDKFIKKVNPKKVFCVHGDKDATIDYKQSLIAKKIDAEAPIMGNVFDLD